MTLPTLHGYEVLRECGNMTIADATRQAQNGTAFVGIAGKLYEVREVNE